MKLKNKEEDFSSSLFFSFTLNTLGASLLGDILIDQGINRAGEGIVRAGYGNKRQDHKNKIDF